MPQRPRTIPTTSIDESKLRATRYSTSYLSKPDIPHQIVRALISGLLVYISKPARRRTMNKFSYDVMAEALLAHAERSTVTNSGQNGSGYTSEQVIPLAHSVAELMKSLLLHPSKVVLEEESNRLLPELSEYNSPTCKRSREERVRWLKDHLPTILKKLRGGHRCPYLRCPARTTMPEKEELETWAETKGVGEIRHRILAYYHKSTRDAVKDLLNRRSPRVKRPTAR